MKNTKALGLGLLALSLLLFCFSCGRGKTESEMKNETVYYLIKVDSVRIDRENKVKILDFEPVRQRFLAFDPITQEFLLLDQRGQVLEATHRVGEGPNEYNSSLIAASFNQGQGGYYTLSSRDFLWFNEKWEVQNRIRFGSYFQLFFYTGPRFKVPYYRLSSVSEPYFYTSFFSGVNSGARNIDGIASNTLIEQYNPQKDSLEWVMSNDPQLLPDFELDKENEQTHPVQVYALDREAKVMYLTFERSHQIGIYDLANDFELKQKISFDQESFSQSNKSKNIALFNFSPETIGVLYFIGLSEAASQARKATDSDYFPSFDPSLHRLIMIQDDLQQKEEIEFPLDCEPGSEMIQLPGNRILLRDQYQGDDEPEYSTYSIFELKSK